VFGTRSRLRRQQHGGFIQQRDYSAPAAGVITTQTATLVGNNGNNDNIGWALGGGMEYAFSNSMSFKVEYLNVSLGNKNNAVTTLSGAPVNAGYTGGDVIALRNSNKFDVVGAGANFRF
jgi:opacity protein-like surface antigen